MCGWLIKPGIIALWGIESHGDVHLTIEGASLLNVGWLWSLDHLRDCSTGIALHLPSASCAGFAGAGFVIQQCVVGRFPSVTLDLSSTRIAGELHHVLPIGSARSMTNFSLVLAECALDATDVEAIANMMNLPAFGLSSFLLEVSWERAVVLKQRAGDDILAQFGDILQRAIAMRSVKAFSLTLWYPIDVAPAELPIFGDLRDDSRRNDWTLRVQNTTKKTVSYVAGH